MSNPTPSCPALAAARKSHNLTNVQIAEKLGSNEQHVNAVLTGAVSPTQAEFSKLGEVLGVKVPAQAKAAHTII
ncbi:hypothetical protein BKA62DRAFT_718139 [Auriculariales sp. MPI-PUGE-AT-0066]|nr:hypothetical protein BKA62DRAFT_718139 [Auriculariales sp. MPI-PUGE-AT-0066]